MKFSWQLINKFIDIDNITFEEFEEQVSLSGIELESIEELDGKKIIDFSITANRKEVNSVFELAREISIIFNIPFKIKPIAINKTIKLHYGIEKVSKHFFNLEKIICVKFQLIEYKKHIENPQWLLSKAREQNISINEPLKNIQEYIKVKWGYTFEIVDQLTVKRIETILNHHAYLHKLEEDSTKTCINRIINFIKQNIKKEFKLLIFICITQTGIKSSLTNQDFYDNLCIDTIKMITTLTKGTISKSYGIRQKIKRKDQFITVKKENLYHCLGSIENKNLQFISIRKISTILKKLHLSPDYSRKEKRFIIQVPDNRRHDLKREIDIIEEIGRIYRYKNFFNKLKNTNVNVQGNQSKNVEKMYRIRTTLSNLGLHEVLNCSLTVNEFVNSKTIGINNPITNEQRELRSNIIESLIRNHEYNIKNNNCSIKIFEVGKIFRKSSTKDKYAEINYLSGLISDKQYIRHEWSKKPDKITLLHVKGILTIFLEKINSNTILKEIPEDQVDRNKITVSKVFDTKCLIGIYNRKTQRIIGIVSKLNKQATLLNPNITNETFLFEINLNKLLGSIIRKNHLDYVIQPYSNYPSVTRDISVKTKYNENIQQIEQKILETNKQLIESVEMLNEYINHETGSSKKERFVSFRITYRSSTRTLNNLDIEKIEKNLHNLVDVLER